MITMRVLIKCGQSSASQLLSVETYLGIVW